MSPRFKNILIERERLEEEYKNLQIVTRKQDEKLWAKSTINVLNYEIEKEDREAIGALENFWKGNYLTKN